MDELAHARAELVQLQSTQQVLVEQLIALQVAIGTQQSKISKLIEERPPLISRLPTELLTRIFSFLFTHSGEDPLQPSELRQNLAGVSRFWRDLVLDNPSFWSIIELDHNSDSNSLMTQLKRSNKHPLDIVILSLNRSKIDGLLDILIPSANRWRSLRVEGISHDPLLCVVHKLDPWKFPCLEDVFINMRSIHHYPRFLLPGRSPALRHMNLGNFCATTFPTATNPLTTLNFSATSVGNGSFLSRIPAHSLHTFTFTASTCNFSRDWVLERDSLYFPLLQRLVLDVPSFHQFMDAIVAPKLDYFEYTHRLVSIFGTLGPKFGHVRHLTLKPAKPGSTYDRVSAVPAPYILCQAFPGVRHATMHTSDIRAIFTKPWRQADSAEQAPVDSWASLERLSLIRNNDDGLTTIQLLSKWLLQRQRAGHASLHVQLIGSDVSTQLFSLLYDELRHCCFLDLEDVWLSEYLCLSSNGGFLHVGLYDECGSRVDSVFLDGWRELSSDVFWLVHARLLGSQTIHAAVLPDLCMLLLALKGHTIPLPVTYR